MKPDRFASWLRNIFNTRDEEISCTDCFELVARFVELEVTDQDAAARMPLLKQHLDQCRACREEYEALRDLRLLEEKGEDPSSKDLQDLIR